jgi:gliding motility-associated-like protein
MTKKNKFFFGNFFLVIFLFLNFFAADAQNDPCFTADVRRGCAPLTVTLKDCSGVSPTLIFYEFVPGAPTQTASFTYTTPGKYSITQIINSGSGAGKSKEEKDFIEVLPAQKPVFELKECVGAVYIHIKDNFYDEYEVEGIGTKFKLAPGESAVKPASGEITVTVRGLFTGSATSCGESSQTLKIPDSFQIAEWAKIQTINASTAVLEFLLPSQTSYTLEQSYGAVFSDIAVLPTGASKYTHSGNSLDVLPVSYRIYAKEFCTNGALVTIPINTTYLNAANKVSSVMLTWNRALPTDFRKYRIFRNEQLIDEIAAISQNYYEDIGVICNENYCYRVEAVFEGVADVLSVSNTVCIRAVSTKKPEILTPFYVTIYNQLAQLQWRKPTGGRDVRIINFIRTQGGAKRDTIYTIPVNDTTFLDLKSNPFEALNCYQISYTDECGNVSDFTREVCPVNLRIWREKDFVNLDWSGYVPEQGHYYLEILNEKEEVLTFAYANRYAVTYNLNNFSEQTTKFRVYFVSNAFVSYSNVVELVLLPEVEYPNAFTPNGDKLNDEFGAVKARFIRNFEINIFNQWGEVVFRSTEPGARWDGNVNGSPAPADTYFFTASYEDLRKISLVTKGYVRLIR